MEIAIEHPRKKNQIFVLKCSFNQFLAKRYIGEKSYPTYLDSVAMQDRATKVKDNYGNIHELKNTIAI